MKSPQRRKQRLVVLSPNGVIPPRSGPTRERVDVHAQGALSPWSRSRTRPLSPRRLRQGPRRRRQPHLRGSAASPHGRTVPRQASGERHPARACPSGLSIDQEIKTPSRRDQIPGSAHGWRHGPRTRRHLDSRMNSARGTSPPADRRPLPDVASSTAGRRDQGREPRASRRLRTDLRKIASAVPARAADPRRARRSRPRENGAGTVVDRRRRPPVPRSGPGVVRQRPLSRICKTQIGLMVAAASPPQPPGSPPDHELRGMAGCAGSASARAPRPVARLATKAPVEADESARGIAATRLPGQAARRTPEPGGGEPARQPRSSGRTDSARGTA